MTRITSTKKSEKWGKYYKVPRKKKSEAGCRRDHTHSQLILTPVDIIKIKEQ